MMTGVDDDIWLAGELATAAGALLMRIRADSGLNDHALGDEGDARSNDFLLDRLAAERPDDKVLSEESADDRSRLDADRVWIVDPLDGTREFRTGVRDDWAVHVALWERGSELTAGAVSLPALGVTYTSTADPVEATAGLAEPRTSPKPRVVVSGSRPPEFSAAVAEAIGGEVLAMGSAGAKAMAVVRGEADAYVHAGGQYEWDSAAPVSVCAAKGLWCSRIDGSPLLYNQAQVYLPDLVICRRELTDAVLGAIAG